MTWIWGILSVIGAVLSLSGAVLVHLRAYDLLKRVETLEDRQQSIRGRVYNELGKTRDEVRKEVHSFLEELEPRAAETGPDIGQALLMQMMGANFTSHQAKTNEEERQDAIHDILIGNGGDPERTKSD